MPYIKICLSVEMTKAIQSSVQVGELATGQALTVPLYSFIGSESSAPSVYIQSNVHGAEVHNT
jgi:predicted deacylase